MTKPEILDVLSELATRELRYDGPLPKGDIAEHFDSVQRLTLVVAIEDKFRVCFDPEDEAGLVTMDDLVTAIQNKVENRQESSPHSH